jgi:hypothetical protein
MAIEKTNINDIIDKNYAEFDLGLICEDRYKTLKHIDMVVYTLLNNQHGLSIKTTLNGSKKFVDKNGYVFISIGQDKLCKLLRTTRPTLNSSLKRLEEVGLIEVVNIGNMKCNRIYVGKLKRTITLGDYMKDMSIGEEDEFIPSIEMETIDEIKDNKKASTVPPVKANKENIKPNKSICNSDINNTLFDEKNQCKKVESEVVKVINKSCVNIRKQDLKDCEEEFTDIDKLKEALSICEINNSHGIKALRMAYKYGNNNGIDTSKRKGSIYMADSKVDVNGELKSVEDMSNEDIAYKLDLKNGTNWSGRNPNAKGIFKANF